MIRLERILVPIDFSPISEVSSRYALEVARVFNAEVVFLHVIPGYSFSARLLFPEGLPFTQGKRLTASEEKQVQETLEEFLSRLPLQGILYSVSVEKGVPSLRILRAALRMKPAALIIATHAGISLENLLVGGTAERVIRKAGCPVLSLRPRVGESFSRKVAETASAIEAEDGSKVNVREPYRFPPRKILYPTDFSEISRSAMDYAVFAAQKANAELIVLHAADGAKAGDTTEQADGEAGEGQRTVEGQMDDLLKEITALFETLRVSPRVVASRPAQAILSTAVQEGVDTIVMGTHGWIGLGLLLSTSTADRVIHNAPCPVLTIRPNWKLEELEKKFERVFKKLSPVELQQISSENQALFEGDSLLDPAGLKKTELFLRYYSKEGIATAFEEYGIFDILRKRGFDGFLVTFDLEDPYRHSLRVYFGGVEEPSHLLIDLILSEGTLQARQEGKRADGAAEGTRYPLLVIEWLCLQNPLASFSPDRPPLPGQAFPGLGIAYEIMEFVILMGMRLNKCAVTNTPQYFHNARWYHEKFTFYNPVQEGRLVAMIRDTGDYNVTDVSWAIYHSCLWDMVTGEKVVWEGGNQVYPLCDELKEYFSSTRYRGLVRDTVANSRFRIDWQLFRRRMLSGSLS